MTDSKRLTFIDGLMLAVVALAVTLSTVDVTKLVYVATGWTMPKWLAISIATIGVAAAVAAALATFGVTLPAAVLKALAIAGTAAA